jgi:hypothetical protein
LLQTDEQQQTPMSEAAATKQRARACCVHDRRAAKKTRHTAHTTPLTRTVVTTPSSIAARASFLPGVGAQMPAAKEGRGERKREVHPFSLLVWLQPHPQRALHATLHINTRINIIYIAHAAPCEGCLRGLPHTPGSSHKSITD